MHEGTDTLFPYDGVGGWGVAFCHYKLFCIMIPTPLVNTKKKYNNAVLLHFFFAICDNA